MKILYIILWLPIIIISVGISIVVYFLCLGKAIWNPIFDRADIYYKQWYKKYVKPKFKIRNSIPFPPRKLQ